MLLFDITMSEYQFLLNKILSHYYELQKHNQKFFTNCNLTVNCVAFAVESEILDVLYTSIYQQNSYKNVNLFVTQNVPISMNI